MVKNLNSLTLRNSSLQIAALIIGWIKRSKKRLDSDALRLTQSLPTRPHPRHWLRHATLAWRIGLALAAVNLVLIAVTVPGISPRSGRSGNLVLALLTFVVYYNLISLGQTWIAGGRIGMGAYLLILHGGAFALAVGWIASRHQNWSLAGLIRSRNRTAAAGSP